MVTCDFQSAVENLSEAPFDAPGPMLGAGAHLLDFFVRAGS
jgi:hypothetical protein